jgi:tRNA dimethylallyltransferase
VSPQPTTEGGCGDTNGLRPVVLLGPTASGKSDVAMAAARAVAGTEIIAVDAMQVYRGMDVGTGKPPAVDRAAVVHHGLDLVEPEDLFTVVDYQRAYDEATAALGARRGRALLVAGTGLYLTAVLERLELPGQWPDVRAALAAEPDLDALHRRLTALDPQAAARIEPGNRRRIVRALEVTIGSGRPFSSFGPGIGAFPPTDVTLIGLRWTRDELARRIARRVDAMLAGGWLDEVERLAERPAGFSPTARQALGYAELLDHLAGRLDLSEAVATIVGRTRRFATRQERWFRRDPRVRWIDVERDPVADALPAVIDALTT